MSSTSTRKPVTSSLVAGTAAIDRATVAKTGRTRNDGAPILAVTVDGIEVGELAKTAGGWTFTGCGFWPAKNRAQAVTAIVRNAVEAGTVTDYDAEATAHADRFAALAVVLDSGRASADNQARACRSAAALSLRPGVRCGDFVTYPDGRTERVGHVIPGNKATAHYGAMPARVATSYDTSLHLSESGATEHSGGFNRRPVVADLVDTGEIRQGEAWIWDQGIPRAGGAVYVSVPFRVFSVRTGAEF